MVHVYAYFKVDELTESCGFVNQHRFSDGIHSMECSASTESELLRGYRG